MSKKKVVKWLTEAAEAHQKGNMEKAETLYRKVLKSDPKNPDALHLTGLIDYQNNRLDSALARVTQAIKYNSQEAIFWNTLGLIQRARGSARAATKSYQRALQLNPNSHETWTNAGVAWQMLNEPNEAAKCYNTALKIRPTHISAINNIGILQIQTKQYTNAINAFSSALEISPDNLPSLGYITSAKQHLCDWEGLEELQHEICQMIDQGVEAFLDPFSFQSMTTSPETLLRCSQAWAKRTMPALERLEISQRPKIRRSASGPIRLAYWSADLREHAVGYLLAEVFECHDREHFEVTLLSYGEDDGSAIRQRHMNVADHFIDIRDNSLEEVVHLCRERQIDILIDLTGYTTNTRSQMLAMHAAPITIQWLGFPGSLGTHHLDYILADDFVIPEGAECYYTENVARLDPCYQPQDSARTIDEPLSRSEYNLPETGIVFISLCQSYKILPRMFDAWMRILSRVPGSVLWLVSASPQMEHNIRAEAQQRGIAPERIVFTSSVPLEQHLARYRAADISLDTFPYGSHGTASDALWAGCPLITLIGETFPSRVAGSVLRAAGLSELITTSLDEYEELAVSLALDAEKLQALKKYMTDTRDTCALFDTPAFTRGLEDAYRTMIDEMK